LRCSIVIFSVNVLALRYSFYLHINILTSRSYPEFEVTSQNNPCRFAKHEVLTFLHLPPSIPIFQGHSQHWHYVSNRLKPGIPSMASWFHINLYISSSCYIPGTLHPTRTHPMHMSRKFSCKFSPGRSTNIKPSF